MNKKQDERNIKSRLNIVKHTSTVCLLVIIAMTFCPARSAFSCTMVLVGKDASSTGKTLIARAEDGGYTACKYLTVTPAKDIEPGEQETFFNGLKWDYPKDMKRTLKFFSLPDSCYGDHSHNSYDKGLWPYSAAGIDEVGVVITATETEDRNLISNKADPASSNGVEECMIPALILPRARSAREGVSILGSAIEKYGSAADPYRDSGEIAGLSVADKNEVWYMEYAGHQWTAIKLPDNKYLVNGNIARICNFNYIDAVNEQETNMGSTDVISFAREKNLPGWNKINPESFDFSLAYGDISTNMWSYSSIRVWWGNRWFSPSQKQKPGKGAYPFLLTPDAPISRENIIAFFRSDKYPTDMDFDFTGDRVVGIDSNMEAHIIEINHNKDVPCQIGTVVWLALGPACDSVYLPFHGGITEGPESYSRGRNVYDLESAAWVFRSLSTLARQRSDFRINLRDYWDKYQQMLFAEETKISNQALALWNDGKNSEAIEYLTKSDIALAKKTLEKARELIAQLITALAQDSEGKFEPELK